MKKTLTSIIVAGMIALSGQGCEDTQENCHTCRGTELAIAALNQKQLAKQNRYATSSTTYLTSKHQKEEERETNDEESENIASYVGTGIAKKQDPSPMCASRIFDLLDAGYTYRAIDKMQKENDPEYLPARVIYNLAECSDEGSPCASESTIDQTIEDWHTWSVTQKRDYMNAFYAWEAERSGFY